ncbi:MAG TPA: GLPGLI family protein [Chryseosolibacter sp.]|nr:GLPGLI family protein [Chryseosolibacter sp.]
MKKIILLLGVLVSVAAARVVFAQTSEGVIIYENKINVHRTLPPERQEMKNMIPEYRTTQEQLAFNATQSLYKPVEEDVVEEDIDEGQGVRMRFRNAMNEYLVDQASARRSVLQEFMGKKYLIEDSLTLIPWKFGTETKEIRGYTCKQASYYNEERKQNIIAWYSDKFRPFLGPENFNTLPGAVLQIDVNEGERVITAKQIETRPLKKNELKLSSGGIKTTQEEFTQLRDEHIKKMKANGANIIIR